VKIKFLIKTLKFFENENGSCGNEDENMEIYSESICIAI
jgi:hypothetical protein